jgi:polar amino acid transport system permease protein
LTETVVISDRRLAREAAKRRQSRRGQAIAAVSTFVIVGGLAALVLTSPGWPTVRETFFSWSVFKEAFPEVLSGFWLDIKVFMIVEVAVLALALVIALVRTSSGPALFPLRMLGTVLGGIALTLSYSAYVAEVYRAGIRSVHRGQRDAALAVGLTDTQAMRHVILPQAVRRVAPPLLNDFVALQKEVALLSILGPQEAFRIAQIAQGKNFNYTPLIAAALLYLAITVPLARVVDRMGGGGEVR